VPEQRGLACGCSAEEDAFAKVWIVLLRWFTKLGATAG